MTKECWWNLALLLAAASHDTAALRGATTIPSPPMNAAVVVEAEVCGPAAARLVSAMTERMLRKVNAAADLQQIVVRDLLLEVCWLRAVCQYK